MPTLHIATLSVTLDHDSSGWWAVVDPTSDSHWVRGETGWEYVFEYEEYGDTVEIRVPTTIEHDGCTFQLAAESQPPSGSAQTWSASGSWLCSPAFSAVSSFSIEVETTPIDTPLPLGLPSGVNPRGGGHYDVKNAGGDGDRRR